MYSLGRHGRAVGWAVASAGVFALGALAQISADLWLARTRAAADVAEWSLFRSIAFTGGVLALVGAERQIFRMTTGAASFFRRSLAVAFCLAAVFAVAAKRLLPAASAIPLLMLGIFGASIVLLSGDFYRGKHRLLAAQWAYSGWKLLFLILCVGGVDLLIPHAGVPVSFLIGTALSLGLLPMLGGIGHPGVVAGDERMFPVAAEHEDPQLRAMFFLLSVDFMLTIYLDQLLLGAFLEKTLLATYFAHLSLMMSPFLLVTSLLVFQYGAWVRSLPAGKVDSALRTVGCAAAASGVLMAVLMLLVAPKLFQMVYTGRYPFTFGLALGLCAAGALRVFSAVPGSLLAVVANRRETALLVAGNAIGLLANVALFVGLFIGLHMNALQATVIALLVNWTVRVLTASLISLTALRRVRLSG